MSVTHTTKNIAYSYNAKNIAYLHNKTKQPIPYFAILRRTKKAVLLLVSKREIWIPNSATTLDEAKKIAYIPIWLLKKRELTVPSKRK